MTAVLDGATDGSAARTPDLSVVISTHDRPAQLREAIEAVRTQTHPGPIETVVVYDKAEPDHSLASDDPHRPVKVIFNERTPGLPGGRNAGAEVATAPVLGFCDDDDLWLPDKAERQLALLEETGADSVSSGLALVVEGVAHPRRGLDRPLTHTDLLQDRHPEAFMGTAMVRTEAFWGPIGPLDEHIPGGYAEDYDWQLRAARHQDVPVVPDPLLHMRWIVQSHFRQKWPDWEQALQLVLDRNPEFAGEPAGRARIEGQVAFAIAAQGRRAEGLRHVRSTLGWNWREPRAYLALAVALGVPARWFVTALNKRGRGI